MASRLIKITSNGVTSVVDLARRIAGYGRRPYGTGPYGG